MIRTSLTSLCNHFLQDMDASEGELVIKTVQPADAGLYQCVTAANNEMKETIKEIELFIECEYS